MNDKYIKIEGSEELIPVIDSYAFIYESEKGKTVLRIELSKDVKSFDEICNLLNNNNSIVIEEYVITTEDTEDGKSEVLTLNNTYYNFCKDFKCNYNATKNSFFIEITKKSDTEVLTETNQAETLDACLALAEMYEAKLS